MGTHVSGPSTVKHSSLTLKDHLNGQDLPFLFKVLSVRTALSIQAHPDKQLAAQLHATDPKNYRDPNHKPEMAIALGQFEALCGFRPVGEISGFLAEIPVLREILGCEQISGREDLKAAFSRLMTLQPEIIASAIAKMPPPPSKDFPLADLFWRLNAQYPNDVGIFCVFFLNYVQLCPGQAVFLAANEPHAYLSGSCVECMATSDNVVRAGLTPKHRDVQTLCEMLTYKTFAGGEELLTRPQSVAPGFSLYASPVPEFSVLKVDSAAGSLPIQVGHSIFLCLAGSAKVSIPAEAQEFLVQKGSILYLPPAAEYSVSDATGDFSSYQAFAPLP